MVFDPFEINRKLFSEWEKKLAEFMDKRMRDPDFMKVVGQGITATMDAKSAIDARLEEWFRTLSLPTKDDLEKVWTTVNALETRLIDLEDRVAALEKKQPIWAGPAVRPGNKPDRARSAGSAAGGPPPKTSFHQSSAAVSDPPAAKPKAAKKPRARRS